MIHEGHAARTDSRHRITASTILLCFFASCAVYDAPPSRKIGAQNGGSSGTSDTAKGGDHDSVGGRGGTGASGTIGGAGTASEMYPGGTDDAGSPHAAGSPDGGADGGAGDVSGGSGDQPGNAAGSATGGGGTGGTTSGGGAGSGGTLSGGGGTGGSAPITELSRQKPATASSQQTGNEPARGNDGDGATRWCAKAGTFPQWWRVDLGATHLLKEFKISFEYSDRKYYYDIETSPDDSAYTLQTRASGTAALQTGVFPDGVSARYVRITVTNADPLNTSKTWASFFEFTVTGS